MDASAKKYDAVIIGAGPNGLAAALTLAQNGQSVCVLEATAEIGGGLKTEALTLPGFRHDVCAAVVPLSLASPFFRAQRLENEGIEWIQPDIALAHPFEDGSSLFLHRSLPVTADALGQDGRAYRALVDPFVDQADALLADVLGPFRLPSHPLLAARFGVQAVSSLAGLVRKRFQDRRTRALFAGLAAHAMVPLEKPTTASFALVLALLAHSAGWPFIRGGSSRLADALAEKIRTAGGTLVINHPVASADDLPPAKAYLFDLTPRQLLSISGLGLAPSYRQKLSRFRYGPGVFKMDWALAEPIPWKADVCRRAGTVHLGGSYEEIAAALQDVCAGRIPKKPFIVLAQPTLFDDSRAPEGKHTAWAYCHVPHACDKDFSEDIENVIERYAPGFRDCISGRHAFSAVGMEEHNANYVGGDIGGGAADWRQLFARPIASLNPYRTSRSDVYLCSSSTPPGGGIHGLCGFRAARGLCRVRKGDA